MATSKKDQPQDIRTCSMCQESYDPHELNHLGQPFLCRCRHHQWSRFLYKTDDVCIHFIPKREFIPELTRLKLYPNPPKRK